MSYVAEETEIKNKPKNSCNKSSYCHTKCKNSRKKSRQNLKICKEMLALNKSPVAALITKVNAKTYMKELNLISPGKTGALYTPAKGSYTYCSL